MTVSGVCYDYLLRGDDFRGSLRVDAFPETQRQISIVPMGEGQFGIWYETEEALLKSLGSMFVRRDGSVMMLLYDDGHWDGDTGLLLTAPASTREDAVALANKLAKELSPNWLGTWQFE